MKNSFASTLWNKSKQTSLNIISQSHSVTVQCTKRLFGFLNDHVCPLITNYNTLQIRLFWEDWRFHPQLIQTWMVWATEYHITWALKWTLFHASTVLPFARWSKDEHTRRAGNIIFIFTISLWSFLYSSPHRRASLLNDEQTTRKSKRAAVSLSKSMTWYSLIWSTSPSWTDLLRNDQLLTFILDPATEQTMIG